MAIIQDIGIVTAYGYAVSKGYTGTEEEFAQAMANAGITLDSITDAVDQFLNTTVPAAVQTVQNEGGTQVTKVQSAGTAQITAVNEAGTTQIGNVNTAGASQISAIQTKGEETIESIPSDYTELSDSVEDLKNAVSQIPTGTYPDMSVGSVFSDDSYTSDQTPYLYRVSGGGVEVGKVEVDKIVGGTVAFNQLVQNGDFSNGTSGWNGYGGTIAVTNKVLAYTSSIDTGYNSIYRDMPSVAGHKYLCMADIDPNGNSISIGVRDPYTATKKTIQTRQILASIGTVTSDGTRISMQMNALAIGATIYVRNFVCFDLTQMFGSTIADYLYSLETATAGAGVAFFRSLFPNDYYEYNAGELKSVEGLTSHDMTGFNQWDEEWEVGTISTTGQNAGDPIFIRSKNYIPVLGNTSYYFKCPVEMRLFYYDESHNFISLFGNISPRVFVTPANCRYLRFRPANTYGVVYNHDICINISDTSKNGTYEPYKSYTYPLDSSLTLRGIPKVADGKMYYDGDTYSADGKVQRKYGIVDLGSLTWNYETSNQRFYTIGIGSLIKKPTTGDAVANGRNAIYVPTSLNACYGSLQDKVFAVSSSSGSLFIVDKSYTDETAFKTAMSGVYLVYELATPTEETTQPYTEYQKVSKYGTEEYVSTGIVPVGHVTKYPADIVSKVDGLPSDFSTLIAPTEKGFTATRAYTVNDLIIVNNQLYRATTSIASGATLTVGTNVVATTIASLIKGLL